MFINNSLILNSLKSCSMQCLYIFSLFWKKYDKIICWSYSTLITFILFYYKIYFWRRQWQPTPVLLPGKSHGRRSLVGCSPWGPEESDMTEQLHFHFSLSCTGEGNGNPLQCSCLENPRDRGAWWAAVHGVAQSRTRLKWLSSSSSSIIVQWGGKWMLCLSQLLRNPDWWSNHLIKLPLMCKNKKSSRQPCIGNENFTFLLTAHWSELVKWWHQIVKKPQCGQIFSSFKKACQRLGSKGKHLTV